MLISAIFLSYFFFVREIESKGDYFRPKPKTSGPWVKPTEGEIWPRPYNQHYLDNILLIDAKTFSFKVRYCMYFSCILNIDPLSQPTVPAGGDY